MDGTDLERAHAQFRSVLARVSDDQWELQTPCSEWGVRALVDHVIDGERFATLLLEGASTEDAGGAFEAPDPSRDARAAFDEAAMASAAAFAAPGVAERTIHHPIGDISGAQFVAMRTGDVGIHAWDLARATGTDETLDPVLVQRIWEFMAPMAEILPGFGVFGEGASGSLSSDEPLQRRLLDISGRRPD